MTSEHDVNIWSTGYNCESWQIQEQENSLEYINTVVNIIELCDKRSYSLL